MEKEVKAKFDFLQQEIEALRRRLTREVKTGPKVNTPSSAPAPQYTIINQGDNITNTTTGGASFPTVLIAKADFDYNSGDTPPNFSYTIPESSLNKITVIKGQFYYDNINDVIYIYLPSGTIADGDFVGIKFNMSHNFATEPAFYIYDGTEEYAIVSGVELHFLFFWNEARTMWIPWENWNQSDLLTG